VPLPGLNHSPGVALPRPRACDSPRLELPAPPPWVCSADPTPQQPARPWTAVTIHAWRATSGASVTSTGPTNWGQSYLSLGDLVVHPNFSESVNAETCVSPLGVLFPQPGTARSAFALGCMYSALRAAAAPATPAWPQTQLWSEVGSALKRTTDRAIPPGSDSRISTYAVPPLKACSRSTSRPRPEAESGENLSR
jgi:hypothetical protein